MIPGPAFAMKTCSPRLGTNPLRMLLLVVPRSVRIRDVTRLALSSRKPSAVSANRPSRFEACQSAATCINEVAVRAADAVA